MPTLRQIAASYWTATALGAALIALHGWWLSRTAHAGEVISGLGGALVVLGIWVAARPYVRNGLQMAINAGLPAFSPGFYTSSEGVQHRARVEQMLPAIKRDVWAERIVAVVVIVVGTLLNGYGTPIARVMGLKI